jgi:hypothetical protein
MEHNARHLEQPQDYWLPRLLFQRGLALVYLIAFVLAVNQFRPLLGEHGLLPVPLFVKQVAFRPNCSKAMAASLGCYGPIRFPDTFRALSEPGFMVYRFTTPQEKRDAWSWWKRELVGTYFPEVSLETPGFRQVLVEQGWL